MSAWSASRSGMTHSPSDCRCQKGYSGRVGARRAEVAEQGAHARLDLAEGREPRLAALEPRQRPKQEQRLVRRALVTVPPDVERGEALDDLVVVRLLV